MLDAYLFVEEATQAATDAVLAMVGGTVRVACPLAGDFALYVAVQAALPGDLQDKLQEVKDVTGLTGAKETYVPITQSPPIPFPTHSAVSDYVGFSLVKVDPGAGNVAAVYADAQTVTSVIGAAEVLGVHAEVLVEYTGDTAGTISTARADVANITYVNGTPLFAYGATASGAGWPT